MRQKLKEYKDLKRELKAVVVRITNFPFLSSISFEKNDKSFSYLNVTERNAEKLIQLQQQYNNAYAKLLDLTLEIEMFVEQIPESRTREIFRYRYLYGFSWEKVAQKIYLSRIQCIRDHDKYLSEFEKS